MDRRSSIAVIAVLALRPAAALAQFESTKHIGILISNAEGDTNAHERIAAFMKRLTKLGWAGASQVKLEIRWTAGSGDKTRKYAKDLTSKNLDVIICTGATAVKRLHQETKTIPIVFVEASDPVATGAVSSMNKPDLNITGFTQFEFAIGGKWLELLRDMKPSLKRVCAYDTVSNPAFPKYLEEILSAGKMLQIEVTHGTVSDFSEFASKIDEFSHIEDGGMIVMPSGFAAANHQNIVEITASNKLLTIYPFRFYVDEGGLFSYGIDLIGTWQKAALYTDRILRGEKPGNLPVQSPEHFDLVINTAAAERMGLTVPLHLLARADDEVR